MFSVCNIVVYQLRFNYYLMQEMIYTGRFWWLISFGKPLWLKQKCLSVWNKLKVVTCFYNTVHLQQEQVDIEEKYSSLQEEIQGKTKKLKKVWTMLMQAKSEVIMLGLPHMLCHRIVLFDWIHFYITLYFFHVAQYWLVLFFLYNS